MEKNLTLVVMAAGMGSRFGGLKQIEPVGPNKEFILDYSVYDAIKAGFNKVVFIIKEENYDLFRDTIGKRIEDKIKVEYTFQKLENIPKGVKIPEERVKPWGTSHAILSCKDIVKGNFVVINADDFYDRDAYMKAKAFFENAKKGEYGLIGYKVCNTLTENGSVKRGVCKQKDGYLTSMIESTVERKNGKIYMTPLSGGKEEIVEEDAPVSMNMFCFTDSVFDYLEKGLTKFFEDNKNNLEKCEYLLPQTIFEGIKEGFCKVLLVPTTSVWQGITYKDDKPKLVEGINKLIAEGKYPQNLWK